MNLSTSNAWCYCRALSLGLFVSVQFASSHAQDVAKLQRMDKLDLGFVTTSMSLSHDGRLAVVWGMSQSDNNRKPSSPGRDELAIVDVNQGRTIATKTFPQGIRTVAIDDRYVFVAPSSGSLIYQLDHSFGNRKRLFLKHEPTRIQKISAQKLVAFGKQFQVINGGTLKPETEPLSLYGDSGKREAIHYVTADEVKLGARILDYDTESVLCILSSGRLPTASFDTQIAKRRSVQARYAARHELWGRQVTSRSLTNDQGHSIVSWPDQEIAAISSHHPIAGVIRSITQGKGEYKVLELRNLVDGAVEVSSLIASWNIRDRRRNRDYRGFRRICFHEDKVFVLHDTFLQQTSIEQVVRNLQPPVHFLAKQQTEIAVGQQAEFDVAVSHASGNTEFQLLVEIPGISMDKTTGRLSINTQLLWDRIIEHWSDSKTRQRYRASRRPSIWERDVNVKNYRSLTGKSLKDGTLATALPISAILRESDGQEDTVDFYIIVTGPRTRLDNAIAQHELDVAQMQEAMSKRLLQTEAISRLGEGRSTDLNATATEKKLDLIETRLRRIEAAMDSILKKFDN